MEMQEPAVKIYKKYKLSRRKEINRRYGKIYAIPLDYTAFFWYNK